MELYFQLFFKIAVRNSSSRAHHLNADELLINWFEDTTKIRTTGSNIQAIFSGSFGFLSSKKHPALA
ncbi:MAG: hypothetical protein B7Y39_12410 [Bdellovibrio sp. 28-41-41]|nr:MAG: hypothetical protein B7Y39_12410 [Bdellovibrio sp. 28-41-41]